MLTRSKLFVAGSFLVSCLAPAPGFAITPTEQIQETIQQVLSVVRNTANSHEQRKEMLRETLMPRFDWSEMARQTLGKHWSVAAGRENEFIGAFAEFLGNSYVGNIGSYKDEKILFVQESIESNRAQVKTKIVPDKGEPTSVNYRLHRVEGHWKIYDVVVDDISIVINYRSQFNRILTRGTFDDLLRQLREKELGARN
jgi:phospholipid transport system substrate-binding protein